MDQSDIQLMWAKVYVGPVFEACMTWQVRRDAAVAAANIIAKEIGAVPDRFLTCGTRVEGLHRPYSVIAAAPGWRPAGKKFPGYIKPNTRNAAGKAFKTRLDAIHWETGESLAGELKLPPFFGGFLNGFCSAVGCIMRSGVFYLEFPASLARHIVKGPGVDMIQEWEYVKARDQK